MAQARKVKRKPAPARSRGPTSGWVWLLAGMIVGLAIAAVVYLQGLDRMGQQPPWLTAESSAQPATPAQAPAPAQTPARTPTPQAATPAAPAPGSSRFQFYEILPQDEITVAPPTPRATPAPSAAPIPATATPPTQTARVQERFVLQAGSFRQFAQADEMKARLALMGMHADIREVRVNGETFHRVFLGPFDSEAQANRALDRLRRENIEAMRLPASG